MTNLLPGEHRGPQLVHGDGDQELLEEGRSSGQLSGLAQPGNRQGRLRHRQAGPSCRILKGSMLQNFFAQIFF